MPGHAWEPLTEKELRQIISNYLDEVLRCYKERQRVWVEGGRPAFPRLEQKAKELLEAMRMSVEPGERRRAILQVLYRANQFSKTSLPS